MLIEEADRRIFFIDSTAKRREAEYYKGFVAWWAGNLGVIRSYLDSIDLSGFNPYEAPPMTTSKKALIASSRSELAQELSFAVLERQGCFDRDIVTVDQARNSLGVVSRAKTQSQLTKALKEIGAASLGQQRAGALGRPSLWAIRNHDYWLWADPAARADEVQRSTGMFAELDGSGIAIAPLSQYPGDVEALLAACCPPISGGGDLTSV